MTTTEATSKVAQVAKATQTCTGCGKTKPLADFPPHPKTPLGVFRKCGQCIGERAAVVHASRRRAEDDAKALRARARRREAEQMNTDAKAILDEHGLPELDAGLHAHQITDLYGIADNSFQNGRAERGIEKIGSKDRHYLYLHRSVVAAFRDERLGMPRVRRDNKKRTPAKIAGYRERISAAIAALEADEAAARMPEKNPEGYRAHYARYVRGELGHPPNTDMRKSYGLDEAEGKAIRDAVRAEYGEGDPTPAPDATDAAHAATRPDAGTPTGPHAMELAVAAAEARGAAMIDPRFQPIADRLTRMADRALTGGDA